MTSRSEIWADLRRLDEHHSRGRDDGYEQIRQVVSYRACLPEAKQALFREVALEAIAAEDPRLWWVLLGALVQADDAAAVPGLVELLRASPLEPDTEDAIVQALLRFNCDAVDYQEYLVRALQEQRGMAVSNLAALVRVDCRSCIEMASEYLSQQLQQAGEANAARLLPAFVHNFIEVDEGLLATLVGEVAHSDQTAALQLAALLGDYLLKPWVVRELGEERARQLVEQVNKAAT
jgi:hypothetical protein